MVHQSSNGVSSLKYIITPEGRLKNTGTNAVPVWGWEYDLKDHLGNVRVIFKPNATNNGVVRVEYANYFPFGMKMLAPYSTQSEAGGRNISQISVLFSFFNRHPCSC